MSNSSTGNSERGVEVLHDPRTNRSTGYTETERQELGLAGLVPDVTESIETQLARVMLQLNSKNTDLDRFIYLMGLLDANERLFYRTLMSDPARFLEIVYDPTIAEACLKFDHIFRRPRGMYLSISRKGQVKEVRTIERASFGHPITASVCATPFGRLRSNREYRESQRRIRRAYTCVGGYESARRTGLLVRTQVRWLSSLSEHGRATANAVRQERLWSPGA
jgi:hypothetical protein